MDYRKDETKPRIYKRGNWWILEMHGTQTACNEHEVALSNLRINLEFPEYDMSKFVNPAWWFKHRLGKTDAEIEVLMRPRQEGENDHS